MDEGISQGVGGALGEVEGGIGWRGFACGGFVSRGDAEELLEAGKVGVAATLELGLGEGFVGAVEHAFGKVHFVGESFEHGVLDGVFGDEIDDGDGAGLMFPPGAGDALFELCRVPGEVAIDDDAGVLEVEADAAGIGAEEEAAVRIVAEGEDLAAAFLLGDAAGVPCVADAISISPDADFFQHAFPLGEDDDFDIGIGEALVEDAGDFVELGAVLAVAVFDDGGRVADHAHHGEQDHEEVGFLLGERSPE